MDSDVEEVVPYNHMQMPRRVEGECTHARQLPTRWDVIPLRNFRDATQVQPCSVKYPGYEE